MPSAALAHDAFGDLGPFYGGLLHPLVDPAQGLILLAVAILLARQPVESVRVAYLVLVFCAVCAAAAAPFGAPPPPGTQASGAIVAVLGLVALTGVTLPVPVVAIAAGGLAAVAGLAGDPQPDMRAMVLAAGATALGIALLVLLMWYALDLLQARLGRVAGAVAGSWIAAVGLMAAALPAVAP